MGIGTVLVCSIEQKVFIFTRFYFSCTYCCDRGVIQIDLSLILCIALVCSEAFCVNEVGAARHHACLVFGFRKPENEEESFFLSFFEYSPPQVQRTTAVPRFLCMVSALPVVFVIPDKATIEAREKAPLVPPCDMHHVLYLHARGLVQYSSHSSSAFGFCLVAVVAYARSTALSCCT